nr:uncharacterized protein C12orf40 homolog isoform X3 [Manis javanica]
MNWVGGSRTRVLIKQERRKQKEYFEKKRLKSKMKLLGVLSPVKNSTASLDLVNLYMVNQISCHKKTPETVRKPTHVNMSRDIKMPLRKHDLELPVSPHCVPSNLCIDDTENNIHHQRLGSKKELGPVQLSQVLGSHRMFEPQFNRIENCSFTPSSFSAELSSNRHITEQNFIPRIAPRPQRAACEEKQNEQLSNVNFSNSLFSKLNENQDTLSPSYKTAQFGMLFERFNSYPEGCCPHRSHQEDSSNERSALNTSSEGCYPANSQKKGKFESDQEKTPQKKIRQYPVNHMGDIPLEGLHSKQSLDFRPGEILIEGGGACSLKGRPTSSKKIYLDSSQSSLSTSYSPRPTDSCFSSSSELSSEDEDQKRKEVEDSNRRSIKTKEPTNHLCLERMAKLPCDRIIKNNAKIRKQSENFHHCSVKDTANQPPQPQCNSHISQNKTSHCSLQVVKCDAWVQTESKPVTEEKLDAAVQCSIISKCECGSDVSSLGNVERCSENIKSDTTGGQEILKNNSYCKISARE